jgi:hypothetical protein
MIFLKRKMFRFLALAFLGMLLVAVYPISANDQAVSKSRLAARGATATVQLFGHVTLVEGYALPTYVGCHALVKLRDNPGKTVAVMTTRINLQSLLETALATGNLICFWGKKLDKPPKPRGGSWNVEVYTIDGVILYNMK